MPLRIRSMLGARRRGFQPRSTSVASNATFFCTVNGLQYPAQVALAFRGLEYLKSLPLNAANDAVQVVRLRDFLDLGCLQERFRQVNRGMPLNGIR